MSTTLQENLEKYLKREGLYAVIAEHRRRALFTMPVILMWAVGLWGPLVYFLLRHQGLRGLTVAIFGPIALFLITSLVLIVTFLIRQIRSGKKISQADAGFVGGIFLLYFPLAMTIALGAYLGSFLIAVTYIGVYIAVMVIVMVLQMQAYRVHLVFELIHSVFRALGRSIALLLVLIPLLLVVTLLSVFSQELWQALGNLSVLRLIGSILCLTFPVLALILGSLNRETISVMGEFPDTNQIIEDAQATPYIKERLDKGFISEEEWTWLTDQLKWRSLVKHAEGLLPLLRKKVKRWLGLLLVLTSLALAVSFFVYFYLFFGVLFPPLLVEEWTGVELTTTMVPLGFFGQYVEVSIPTTAVAIAKVALVLAVFVAVTSSVYALTDESIKAIFTEWLRRKVSSWQAASFLYLCVISPNYQIWEYRVRDKDKGIANASIVVPKGSSEELVEKACEHMASRLDEYRHLVIITAFEENPNRPVYELGMPGNRWRLLHNKSKDIKEFEAIPLVLEELRYQHLLGRNSLDNGTEIPEDWFGDTPEGKALAKTIWEEDSDHEWVLHPYVFTSDKFLSLEISLAKRMSTSDQYREYVRGLLASARKSISTANTLWIELTFRDTIETLARVHWSTELPYVEYKDELADKNRIEKPEAWE